MRFWRRKVPSEKDVIAALRAVPGPDGRTPLPDSGALAGVSLRNGKVYVAINVEASRARVLEPMRAAAENAVLAMPGIEGAVVTLTSERAPGQPAPAAQRPRPQLEIPGVKRIVAVASGKGGVGKSTTSVNLALALQAEGWKVGLLDADIFGPSAPRLFGVTDRPMAIGEKLVPLDGYGVKVMSMGFLVEERTAMIWRGPMVVSALNKMLREVAWGDLDCLVVDMPPGTGDAQLTMAQSVPLSGAIIVSTPQDLALIDARRGISMFEQVAVPILGIIENMSYFLCPHCGGRSDIFGHGGAREEARTLGVPFLGEVPLALALRETSDAGRPIVATAPDSEHAQTYRAVARAVKAALEGASQRAAPNIVIE